MFGTPLIITPHERAQIATLMELAQRQSVNMIEIMDRLERPLGKELHLAQMTAQTIFIPFAFMVTFSIETNHPCGTCRHLSMSSQREGRIPNEHAMLMLAQEFGFWGTLQDCQIWKEELLGHGIAINLIQPIARPGSTKGDLK